MIGVTVPPVAAPHNRTPIAKLRLLGSKYVDTTDIIGTKKNPFPTPIHTPCANTNCQYSLHILVKKIPISHSRIPHRRIVLKWPTSDAAPDHSGMSMSRKIMMEPIHEIFDGVESELEM